MAQAGAENGDDFAQDILSRMYFEGAVVEKSLSESLKWALRLRHNENGEHGFDEIDLHLTEKG